MILSKKAFTLVEVLVTVSIIGILMSTAIAGYSVSVARSKDAKKRADLAKVQSALENFRSNDINGSYPPGVGTGTQNYAALTAILVPNYIQSLPTDEENSYEYTPTCTTEGTPICLSYILSANLEGSSENFALNEMGEVVKPAEATTTPCPKGSLCADNPPSGNLDGQQKEEK